MLLAVGTLILDIPHTLRTLLWCPAAVSILILDSIVILQDFALVPSVVSILILDSIVILRLGFGGLVQWAL